MTIIAYKAGKIAGDRAIFARDILVGASTKVVSAFDGTLIGAAGESVICNAFASYAAAIGERAFDKSAKMIAHEADERNSTGLVVTKDGRLRLYELKTGLFDNIDVYPFFAIGSGSEFAMGAMAQGASAVDAALIACRLSVYCGGGVDWLDHDGNGGRIDG